MSVVLDALCRRPFSDFVKFCGVLISVDQVDVIVDHLSPEVQADANSSNSNNSSSVRNTATDAVPSVITSDVRDELPRYDWRAVMRRNFTVLTEKLDPDNGLFEMLRSRGVVSDWNIDVFKVCIALYTSCVCAGKE